MPPRCRFRPEILGVRYLDILDANDLEGAVRQRLECESDPVALRVLQEIDQGLIDEGEREADVAIVAAAARAVAPPAARN